MNDEIFTVAQAASYLKVAEKTVLRMIKGQRLLASQVGRNWRIKLSDIDAYLVANSNRGKGAKSK